MRFLSDSEVEDWASEHGFSGTAERDLRTRMYYDELEGRKRSLINPAQPERAPALAATLVATLGEWDEAVLWITRWGVWPSSEDWPAFYAARGVRGERRSIDDTPGHGFAREETPELIEFVALAIQNGWDAFVLAATGSSVNLARLRISHDEWAELQRIKPISITVRAG